MLIFFGFWVRSSTGKRMESDNWICSASAPMSRWLLTAMFASRLQWVYCVCRFFRCTCRIFSINRGCSLSAETRSNNWVCWFGFALASKSHGALFLLTCLKGYPRLLVSSVLAQKAYLYCSTAPRGLSWTFLFAQILAVQRSSKTRGTKKKI